jgi:gluconolactonase
MTNTTQPIEIDVRDERLRDLLDPQASIARLATGFQFTEGPVWIAADNSLIFSDIIGNTMYRWSRAAGVSVFRQPSNMANGNTLDRDGRLLTCEHATSRLTRTNRSGTIEVLAAHYNGAELNSPNDVIVRSDGSIWFTDPLAGRTATYGVERPPAQPNPGVYRLDPANGSVQLLIDDFVLPNGLCFSPDEQRLFVNDTRRGHIRAFAIGADGALADGVVWATLQGDDPGVPDGMKVDRSGNVWCTGPGGLHVFAPDAAWLGVIRLPERAANFAWGEDGHTLFITAGTTVYATRTRVAGWSE